MTSDHLPNLATFINKKEKPKLQESNHVNKKYNIFKAEWNIFKNNLPIDMPLGICNNVD